MTKSATVLGSNFDTVEPRGRQLKQFIKYTKIQGEIAVKKKLLNEVMLLDMPFLASAY
jgi:hypothetical protein